LRRNFSSAQSIKGKKQKKTPGHANFVNPSTPTPNFARRRSCKKKKQIINSRDFYHRGPEHFIRPRMIKAIFVERL